MTCDDQAELTRKTFPVVGVGNVGLPPAMELGKRCLVIGLEIKLERIAELHSAEDGAQDGDAPMSREFCHGENAVQANLLAATTTEPQARNQIYNVAVGGRTTLAELFDALRDALAENRIRYEKRPVHRAFRAGDVRHSQPDMSKAGRLLGYAPGFDVRRGVAAAMRSYVRFLPGRKR